MKKKTKKRLMRFMKQNNLVIMVIAIDSPMPDLPPSDMKAKDFVKNEKYFNPYKNNLDRIFIRQILDTFDEDPSNHRKPPEWCTNYIYKILSIPKKKDIRPFLIKLFGEVQSVFYW